MAPLATSAYCVKFDEALTEFKRITNDINPGYVPEPGVVFDYATEDRQCIRVSYSAERGWHHEARERLIPGLQLAR